MPKKRQTKWLSLQEASKLIGVHPSTLRQWADTGKVHTHRTPGGHRRFDEADLKALTEPASVQSAGMKLLVDSALGRIRMEVTSENMEAYPWYRQMGETDKAEFRAWGRDLMQNVFDYLSQSEENEEDGLQAGRALGVTYGEKALKVGLSCLEAVNGYLFFQQKLLEGVIQLSETMGGQTNLNLLHTHQRINNFSNQILLAMLETFEKHTSP